MRPGNSLPMGTCCSGRKLLPPYEAMEHITSGDAMWLGPKRALGAPINVSQLMGYWPKFRNSPPQNQKITGEFDFLEGHPCASHMIPIWRHVNRFCEDMELPWSGPVHSIPSSRISSVDFFWTSPDILVVRSGGGHDIAFKAAYIILILRLAKCDTLLDSTQIATIFKLNGA